ncbi:MAG: hypothetical protein KDK70_43025 [Myxococcales bacterium]|nr:hypothetical protein [Myxococcales bacterium]
MRHRAIEEQLRGLVARVAPGARIYFPRKRGWQVGTAYSWNGRHLRPTGLTLESQLHEIAHLLLAAPDRLDQVEFGLGPDPYRRYDVPRTISKQAADLEELHACWMQLLLTHLLELDVAAVCYEYQLEPLTPPMVAELHRTYPDALPADWWQRALERFAADQGAHQSTHQGTHQGTQ